MTKSTLFKVAGERTWIVPAGITEVEVTGWAAGDNYIDEWWNGTSILPATPGDTWTIRVGGARNAGAGGYNGGGDGLLFTDAVTGDPISTAGFGATDIQVDGDRVFVVPGHGGRSIGVYNYSIPGELVEGARYLNANGRTYSPIIVTDLPSISEDPRRSDPTRAEGAYQTNADGDPGGGATGGQGLDALANPLPDRPDIRFNTGFYPPSEWYAGAGGGGYGGGAGGGAVYNVDPATVPSYVTQFIKLDYNGRPGAAYSATGIVKNPPEIHPGKVNDWGITGAIKLTYGKAVKRVPRWRIERVSWGHHAAW